MTIKKIISQLEDYIQNKFYFNRRNNYIHLGLDKSLFSFTDYKDFLNSIDLFLTEHL